MAASCFVTVRPTNMKNCKTLGRKTLTGVLLIQDKLDLHEHVEIDPTYEALTQTQTQTPHGHTNTRFNLKNTSN